MHSRMRNRVTEFLKVLNRAKPEVASERKTITYVARPAVFIPNTNLLKRAHFQAKLSKGPHCAPYDFHQIDLFFTIKCSSLSDFVKSHVFIVHAFMLFANVFG